MLCIMMSEVSWMPCCCFVYRPSRGHKYTPKGPLSPDGNKLLQDLMNKQAAERRKIEEIRASAPPMSSPFDDMDMDDDDLEEDALASLLPSSKKKKKGGAEAEDEEVKMCLDNDDDIDALRDQIKGVSGCWARRRPACCICRPDLTRRALMTACVSLVGPGRGQSGHGEGRLRRLEGAGLRLQHGGEQRHTTCNCVAGCAAADGGGLACCVRV